MMDSNEVLAEIRTLASKVSGQVEEVRRAGMAAPVYTDLADLAMSLASRVWLLDGHLTAGGTPPEVWREGPDAVADGPAREVLTEVGSEIEMTANNMGDEASAADYAADVVTRLVRAYELHGIAAALGVEPNG